MARYGFIHDKLDIKFLILYFMAPGRGAHRLSDTDGADGLR